jgi:hypothetical protein
MQNFKKAIIALDGISSKIEDKNILINIRYALNALHIPFEIFKSHTDGFKKLQEDMNQEDTLYILNDSLQYHLCEKPNILIGRSPSWVQAVPKANTIGTFCQQMLSVDASQLISCIARNEPVRQHFDHNAPKNFILVNEYMTAETGAMGRNGFAAFSWSKLLEDDIHGELLLHTSKEWPLVNQMLREGVSCFSHPDDILIIINRDICLVPEATAIIRSYMDLHNIDSCFAKRIDIITTRLLTFHDIKDVPEYEGIDLFAFRPSASCIDELSRVDLMLGRATWDNFWADKAKNKLPYNVCYHLPHESEWLTQSGVEGNLFNCNSISENQSPTTMGIEKYGSYFKDLK